MITDAGTGNIFCICWGVRDKLNIEKIDGYDISPEMVNMSKQLLSAYHNANCYITDSNASKLHGKYNVIYSSAIFAHISDDVVNAIFSNLNKHLLKNGYFILYEQVGARHIDGKTYSRRTMNEYRTLLEKTGFEIVDEYLIDYWFHRKIFELHISKWFYRHSGESDQTLQRIICNRNSLFKLLSKICTVLSFPCVFKRKVNGWGYYFAVVRTHSEGLTV